MWVLLHRKPLDITMITSWVSHSMESHMYETNLQIYAWTPACFSSSHRSRSTCTYQAACIILEVPATYVFHCFPLTFGQHHSHSLTLPNSEVSLPSSRLSKEPKPQLNPRRLCPGRSQVVLTVTTSGESTLSVSKSRDADFYSSWIAEWKVIQVLP